MDTFNFSLDLPLFFKKLFPELIDWWIGLIQIGLIDNTKQSPGSNSSRCYVYKTQQPLSKTATLSYIEREWLKERERAEAERDAKAWRGHRLETKMYIYTRRVLWAVYIYIYSLYGDSGGGQNSGFQSIGLVVYLRAEPKWVLDIEKETVRKREEEERKEIHVDRRQKGGKGTGDCGETKSEKRHSTPWKVSLGKE